MNQISESKGTGFWGSIQINSANVHPFVATGNGICDKGVKRSLIVSQRYKKWAPLSPV